MKLTEWNEALAYARQKCRNTLKNGTIVKMKVIDNYNCLQIKFWIEDLEHHIFTSQNTCTALENNLSTMKHQIDEAIIYLESCI